MLSAPDDATLLLEDDVTLPPAFGDALAALLAALPDDKDVVQLCSCCAQDVGPVAGKGSRVLRSGIGTTAFVLRRRAAAVVLRHAPILAHMYIDNFLMMGYLPQIGALQAYVADPPLCAHGNFQSTINPRLR
jgi:GR25 family glycosyltransferase involved in LPS biosynthesis